MSVDASQDEFQNLLDGGSLQILSGDPDHLVFRLEGGFVTEFSLRDVVYARVGRAETVEDADQLLDLSRHLAGLSKEVRRAADQISED